MSKPKKQVKKQQRRCIHCGHMDDQRGMCHVPGKGRRQGSWIHTGTGCEQASARADSVRGRHAPERTVSVQRVRHTRPTPRPIPDGDPDAWGIADP